MSNYYGGAFKEPRKSSWKSAAERNKPTPWHERKVPMVCMLKPALSTSQLARTHTGSIHNTTFKRTVARPDRDKYLTLKEAGEWYRYGYGQPLTVSLRKINLRGISAADFPDGKDSKEPFNLLFRLVKGKDHSVNDALVYGTITLIYLGGNRVKAAGNDTYDFDIKDWNGNIIRNLETIAGNLYAGVGCGFDIHFEGEGKIGN